MKKKTEILLHCIIVISTVLAVGSFFAGARDALGSTGSACLKYFTTDSNILAAMASALCLAYSRAEQKPKWMRVFRFASTVAVAITLFTVLFFLAPTAALKGHGIKTALRFFEGNVFVLHFSTPVLSIIALLLDNKDMVEKRDTLWALVPVVIYSLVYLVNVVFLGIWRDWYGFTFGGKAYLSPLVMAAMYLFAFLVSRVLYKLKTALNK